MRVYLQTGVEGDECFFCQRLTASFSYHSKTFYLVVKPAGLVENSSSGHVSLPVAQEPDPAPFLECIGPANPCCILHRSSIDFVQFLSLFGEVWRSLRELLRSGVFADNFVDY